VLVVRGLVVVLENVYVMFHLINRGQLYAMAFELNGLAHLSARIPSAYVRPAALNTTRWIGGPNTVNEQSNRWRDPELFVPGREVLSTEHGRPTSSLVEDSADCRWPTSEASFLFSPGQLLRARLRQVTLLERNHVAQSGFIDQLLQLAAVLDSGADFGHQLLWNVKRESMALASAIESVTSVTFTGRAKIAVLPDAGAFSERQRAGSYRPKLLDSSEKPAAELFTSLNPFHCMRVSIHICSQPRKDFLFSRRTRTQRGH
jgi:hypothetical protein